MVLFNFFHHVILELYFKKQINDAKKKIQILKSNIQINQKTGEL